MATPAVTVTMIGPKSSGKTMYMLGMYATLSAGTHRYFLMADADLDLDLTERWDALLDDGELPQPSPAEVPVNYPLEFRMGTRKVVDFSWQDYRGGAMDDHTRQNDSSPDAVALLDRLGRSETIYLVVNGWKLMSSDYDDQQVIRKAIRRMSFLCNEAIRIRQSRNQLPPSYVIVVTKTDLLRRGTQMVPAAKLTDLLVGELQSRLLVCFQEGVSSLVCPVQIGDFGQEEHVGGKVDARTVRPLNLEWPLVFSFLNYLDGYQQIIAGDLDDYRSQAADHRARAQALRKGWLAMFRLNGVRAANAQAADAERRMSELTERFNVTAEQLAYLTSDLEDAIRSGVIAAFEDGNRIMP